MKPQQASPSRVIKLSQNENAFGAPPKALRAIEKHYYDVFRYPDVLHHELRQKLANKHCVTPDNIIVSAGSIELIDISIKTFVKGDENIVAPEVTFEGYKYLAKANGRPCKLAALTGNTIDLRNMLSCCDESTRIIFMANPNNPTGTLVTHNDMQDFLETLDSDIYVVSDEAYAEYVTDEDYPNSIELQKIFPNLIILHTFSKIYGIAGLRIGYAIAHPNIIQALMQHRTPFSVNSLAMAAALAALDDSEYIAQCVAVNAEERMYLYSELKSMGFAAIEPKGNFIFIEFGGTDEKDKVCDLLRDEGVLIRTLKPFGAENGLRITVGRPEDNRFLVSVLRRSKVGKAPA